MVEPNIINPKDIKIINPEQKEGLLEELNLPPKAIQFIRANERALQIALVVFVVCFLGWTYWGHYTETKRENASSALALAMLEADPAVRDGALSAVLDDFSGSSAAYWAMLEKGHALLKSGEYETALKDYREVASELSGKSPLQPYLLYGIALCLENLDRVDEAYAQYQKLSGYTGYELSGQLAMARMLELQGKAQEALDLYRKVQDNEKLPPQKKSIVTEKMNTIMGDASGAN
ncbi:MAG: tetratricopeptide repeat protein [Proteobacteria bacterium]|nr:tetratricopeptide repeat protein [Pseudomonadota bacterium]MBU1686582.1 tetratricopeptide repeat protein [Pseudomonadota bacterium]